MMRCTRGSFLAVLAGTVLLAGGAALALWSPPAGAFPTYSTGNGTGNCAGCHGMAGLLSTPGVESPYVSRRGGAGFVGSPEPDPADWGTGLMQGHLNFGLGCTNCHSGPTQSGGPITVLINSDSFGGVSCLECHGRPEDQVGNGVGENCTGLADAFGGVEKACGRGAGLRAHHENSQLNPGACTGCHAQDVGRQLAPESVNTNFYNILSWNACGNDNRFGNLGLDNDGDGQTDASDPDCGAPSPEVCDDGQDNDQNGLIDCADPACTTFPGCDQPPTSETDQFTIVEDVTCPPTETLGKAACEAKEAETNPGCSVSCSARTVRLDRDCNVILAECFCTADCQP